jgi:ATP-dependent DNA helicase DinG
MKGHSRSHLRSQLTRLDPVEEAVDETVPGSTASGSAEQASAEQASAEQVIEVQVHQQLRAFLRDQPDQPWPHHLTMARLVARALRQGRSALIQTSALGSLRSYRLSYLMPLLFWRSGVILVAPEAVLQRLLLVEIPRLRQWVPSLKPICQADRWPGTHAEDFQGLLLTTPESWLADRIHQEGRFPDGIPTVIEGADGLEDWVAAQMIVRFGPADWEALMLAAPGAIEAIRDVRTGLIHSAFGHPANPYDDYWLDPIDRQRLQSLDLEIDLATPAWRALVAVLNAEDGWLWLTLDRRSGTVTIEGQCLNLADRLGAIWARQPLVLIGEAINPDIAPRCEYLGLDRLELEQLTVVRFNPDRQREIQLYLPEGLPLPNTPRFQGMLLTELHRLLTLNNTGSGLAVLIINDQPLKSQIAASLAAGFGSRVQVETTALEDNGILVCGWRFWQTHQERLPAPQLLTIATLPFPSLEQPQVAGRVDFHKRHRQDWFKHYLLPTCLGELQRAIAPVRESNGLVALLDIRVLHRSYGSQILAALEPAGRISRLDPDLFELMWEP